MKRSQDLRYHPPKYDLEIFQAQIGNQEFLFGGLPVARLLPGHRNRFGLPFHQPHHRLELRRWEQVHALAIHTPVHTLLDGGKHGIHGTLEQGEIARQVHQDAFTRRSITSASYRPIKELQSNILGYARLEVQIVQGSRVAGCHRCEAFLLEK